MPSFDIVSRIKIPEVDNAIQSALREMNNRFDFKGSACSIERNDQTLQLLADNDLKLRQVQELLRGHLAKRKVEVGFLDFQTPEKAFGNSLRQNVVIKQGVERELAQKITKTIKASKKKVQESAYEAHMADDIKGSFKLIVLDKLTLILVFAGTIDENWGNNRTSSNVSASFIGSI